MSFMKVTRRMVNPITFTESMYVEILPRKEDSILDNRLEYSMSYPPRKRSCSPIQPEEEEMGQARPPTPPKQRGKVDPNSPRDPSLSPEVKRRLLKSGGKKSNLKTKKTNKSLIAHFLSNIGEDEELSEGSMTELSAQLQTSLRFEEEEKSKAKGVRFADENELNEISRLRNSVVAEMFWASDDLANFRYEAFMEEAGLDIEEFD